MLLSSAGQREERNKKCQSSAAAEQGLTEAAGKEACVWKNINIKYIIYINY